MSLAGRHTPVEVDHVGYEGGDARARGGAKQRVCARGERFNGDHSSPYCVVDVVVEVGQTVGDLDDLALQRVGDAPAFGSDALAQLRVLQDPVADFLRQVEALAVFFEQLHHAHALLVVTEPTRQARAERIFASVAKRGVPQIVTERDRLGQVLVEIQAAGDRPRDLHHLHGVRQPRAVVIANGRDEDLRFVLQAAERLGVNDAVPIDLVRGAHRVGLLGVVPIRALARASSEFTQLLLALLGTSTNVGMRPRRPVERRRNHLSVGVCPNAACAAARRAIGTRPGAQLT